MRVFMRVVNPMQGVVLVIVLVFMLILSILVLGMCDESINQIKMSKYYQHQSEAYWQTNDQRITAMKKLKQ